MTHDRDRQTGRSRTKSKRVKLPVDDSDEESDSPRSRLIRGLFTNKLAINWWKEPDMGVPAGERQGCSAARMWRAACNTLVAPAADEAWHQIVKASPSENLWHSLRNCVAHQAGVWQSLLNKGIDDVMHPAAFKLAIVIRHTPSELAAKLLAELLSLHPQSQDLISYVLALLTDDEPTWCSGCECGANAVGSPAPLRDLLLFGDLELCILGASREEYDAHAKRVRAEYATLTQNNFVELRIKVLSQFNDIPKLFQSPEFESFEATARENMDWEVCTLREHLLSGRRN